MALTPEQLERLKELHAMYGGPSAPQEEQPGFLKRVALGTGIPRFAANLVRAGQIITPGGVTAEDIAKDPAKPVNMPWLGPVKPVGQEGTFGEKIKDTYGESFKLASTVVPVGGAAGTVGKATLAGRVAQGAAAGLKGGVFGGSMYGFGEGLQQEDATIESVAGSTLGGAVLGGIAGGAIGAAIPAVGAAVRGTYRSVITPAEQKARNEIATLFEKGVKPNLPGKTTPTLRAKFNNAVGEGVQIINRNKKALQFTDDVGDTVTGRAPQTLKEFSDALEQTKSIIYKQYDDLATQANQKGVVVDPIPIAKELDDVINNKALQLSHPEAVRYAKEVQKRFLAVGEIDANTAQEVIKNYNNSLEAFYRNPTPEGMTRNAVDAMMVNRIRKALDEGIEGATDGGYQVLKNQYAALKTIERDVMRATLRDARRNVKGLIDYTDIFSGGQIVNGILSMNPATIASGIAQKGIASYFKFLNNPNRAIRKMFEVADNMPAPKVSAAAIASDQRLRSKITKPSNTTYTSQSTGNVNANPIAPAPMSNNPNIGNTIDTTLPQPAAPSTPLSTATRQGAQKNSSGNNATIKAFEQSSGQKMVGGFALGSFGENALSRKVANLDRFPVSELDETQKYITNAYRASADPKNYRHDNIAWVADMPNGEKRVIYTRKNAQGKEEIINAHVISDKKYEETLATFGAPAESRTRIFSLEGKRSNPLTYRGNSTIQQKEGAASGFPTSKIKDWYKRNLGDEGGYIAFGNRRPFPDATEVAKLMDGRDFVVLEKYLDALVSKKEIPMSLSDYAEGLLDYMKVDTRNTEMLKDWLRSVLVKKEMGMKKVQVVSK